MTGNKLKSKKPKNGDLHLDSKESRLKSKQAKCVLTNYAIKGDSSRGLEYCKIKFD